MHITHLGHACLLVEAAGRRIVIDPGAFAADFSDQRELDAIIVTHAHPDHFDRERVPALVDANPQALVLADPGTLSILDEVGIPARTHDGSTVIGDVIITPVGQTHALIHQELERIPNVGVLIEGDGIRLYHPGDALDADPGEVDVVAFPLHAPWAQSREMTAFLRRLDPPAAFPIHDGLLNDTGRALYLNHARVFGGAHTEVRDLAGAGATSW